MTYIKKILHDYILSLHYISLNVVYDAFDLNIFCF